METKFSKQRIYKYANGATLIYDPNELNEETKVVMGFKTGSRCDGKYPGLTHLFEHLTANASNGRYMEDEMSNITRDLSIDSNARTGYKFISYEFTIVSEYLQKIFEMNMNKMTNKDFGIDRIRKEVKIIEEEITMRLSDNKRLLVDLTADIKKDVSIDNIIGDMRSLIKITPKILKEYSEKYFVGENMVVSISSDLAFEDIVKMTKPWVEGRIPSKPENEVFDTDIVDLTKHKQIYQYFFSPTCSTSIIVGLVNMTSKMSDIDKAITTIVFGKMLNGKGGDLFQVLRLEKELTYSSRYKMFNEDDFIFDFFDIKTSGNKVNDVLESLASIINRIKVKGITQDEFDKIKQSIYIDSQKEAKFQYGKPTINFINYIYQKTSFDIHQINEEINKLSLEEMNTLIKNRLSPELIRYGVKGDFDIANTMSMESFMQSAFTGLFDEYVKKNPYNLVGENPALVQEVAEFNKERKERTQNTDKKLSKKTVDSSKGKAEKLLNQTKNTDTEISPTLETFNNIKTMLSELNTKENYRQKVQIYNRLLREYDKFSEQIKIEKIDLVLEKNEYINNYISDSNNMEKSNITNDAEERNL